VQEGRQKWSHPYHSRHSVRQSRPVTKDSLSGKGRHPADLPAPGDCANPCRSPGCGRKTDAPIWLSACAARRRRRAEGMPVQSPRHSGKSRTRVSLPFPSARRRRRWDLPSTLSLPLTGPAAGPSAAMTPGRGDCHTERTQCRRRPAASSQRRADQGGVSVARGPTLMTTVRILPNGILLALYIFQRP